MQWHPHVTVATIIERDGHFLMVEELDGDKPVYNQPAGHLEADESLPAAALRETLEETAWDVRLTGFLGIYQYQTAQGTTYIRHCFTGSAENHHPDRELDTGILAAHWLTAEEILAPDFPVRSIAVQKVMRDYLSRTPLPLDSHYFQIEFQAET